MRLLKIDVKTPETGVKTKEGVSLWLDSVVTVQVYSENSTVSDEEVRNAGYDDIRCRWKACLKAYRCWWWSLGWVRDLELPWHGRGAHQ